MFMLISVDTTLMTQSYSSLSRPVLFAVRAGNLILAKSKRFLNLKGIGGGGLTPSGSFLDNSKTSGDFSTKF